MKALLAILGWSLCLLLSGSFQRAAAHGADDHEHAAPVGNTLSLAPRASAQTEDFELLLVVQGDSLLIYLDRFADNAPVLNAKIELEATGVAGLKGVAQQIEPGVYRLSLAKGLLQKPGKYPLSITIQAGDLGDVLTASLEIPEEAVEHDHDEAWPWWGWGGLAVLAVGALLALWRRKTRLNVESKLIVGVK